MDIEKVRQLVAGRCTKHSYWEFINFVIEPYGEFKGRAILSVLSRLSELEQFKNNTVDSALFSEYTAEIAQLTRWISQFSEAEIIKHLDNLEDEEPRYWAERLGREAAVDLLSTGRVSKETMSRAVLLSEDDYRLFAETCGSITHVVNTISKEVEQQQGLSVPENMGR